MSMLCNKIIFLVRLHRDTIAECGRAISVATMVFAVIALVWEMIRPGLVVSVVSPARVLEVFVFGAALALVGQTTEVRMRAYYKKIIFFLVTVLFALAMFLALRGWIGLTVALATIVVFLSVEMVE